jgi:CRP/FNR family transcriptional regulator, cyclic AMP receptor protein
MSVNEVWYGVVSGRTDGPAPNAWLARHPLFEGADPRFVSALGRGSAELRLNVGDQLCRRGDPADRLYILRRGCLEIDVAHDRTAGLAATVGEGGVVCGPGASPTTRWAFGVRALASSDVIAIEIEALRAALRTYPGSGTGLLSRLLCSDPPESPGPRAAHPVSFTRRDVRSSYRKNGRRTEACLP